MAAGRLRVALKSPQAQEDLRRLLSPELHGLVEFRNSRNPASASLAGDGQGSPWQCCQQEGGRHPENRAEGGGGGGSPS